nr:MAG TPA: hypothetical protein [Caudoviricetes sp.]
MGIKFNSKYSIIVCKKKGGYLTALCITERWFLWQSKS